MFARSCEIEVHEPGCQKKQTKSNDQKHPATRYYLINKPRSLDMKNYLVTGGLSSVTKPCNNYIYLQDIYTVQHAIFLRYICTRISCKNDTDSVSLH